VDVRKWTVCLGLFVLVGCGEGESGPPDKVADLLGDAQSGGAEAGTSENAPVEDPNGGVACRGRAEAHYLRGEFVKAYAEFSRALELAPDAQTYYNRGAVLSAQGMHAEALLDYSEALRRDPNHAAAHFNRGVAYGQLGRTAEAIEDLNEAIRLTPTDARAYLFRGTLLLSGDELDRAHADFTRAIALDPKCSEAYTNRGHVACLKQQYDAALRDLDEAIRLAPQSALAYNHRGNAYSKKWRQQRAPRYLLRAGADGHVELAKKALKDFDAAIRLDPQDAQAFNNRGAVYAELGDHPQAIADFSTAITLQPAFASAHLNRGHSYHEIGDSANARANYQEAIRLNTSAAERVPLPYRGQK
jgi:tetratricopeptide (TPR) repeat protein